MLGRFAALFAALAVTCAPAACKKPGPTPPDAPDAAAVGGDATAEGVPQQDLKRVIRENRPAMEACYDAALAKNPATSGKIELVFAVLRDGSVDPKTLGLAGEAKDPELAKCVLDVVVKAKFPPAGSITNVQFPVDLAKRGDAGGAK